MTETRKEKQGILYHPHVCPVESWEWHSMNGEEVEISDIKC